jgi:hypothetical protein
MKLFYNNASERGYVKEEYAKMVAHICYMNKDFSHKIAKHILKGTNKSTAEEIGPFLELLKNFLTVDDIYFDVRMEWIFGVADFCVKNPSYTIYTNIPKVGVANADTIASQVCRYFSPVLKGASSMYNNKESALQALFTNKR